MEQIRCETAHREVSQSQPARDSVCKCDPGPVTNPAFAAAIAPKAVTPESLNWKVQIGEPKLESPDLQVSALESKRPVLVTRLKTSVTWAKSTKLVTLTVKPFAFGHNL
jgi:hypothetical protein